MKTCVSSYSFQPMLSSGEITQLQLIGKVKEMGFDGIEFIDLMPEDGMSVEEYAKRLRDEKKKKNLPIVRSRRRDRRRGGDNESVVLSRPAEIRALGADKLIGRHFAAGGIDLDAHARADMGGLTRPPLGYPCGSCQ